VPTKITVEPFGESYECADGESILDGALRNGFFLKYGCRHGGCGTCKVALTDGDVEAEGSSFAVSSGERADGILLACSSRPTADCTIDVDAMELTEDEFRAGDQVTTFEVEVAGLERLTHDTRALRLALRSPTAIPFTAGQFVNVVLPGTAEVRSYSLANAPDDTHLMDLVVKLLPGGAFSALLQSGLHIGDRLTVHGPLGELRLRLSHRKVLMVAGGSGLAPFLSMLRNLERRNRSREIDLVFGARTRADLYFVDELERLVAALTGVRFVPTLSEPDRAPWNGERGLVTEVIARRYTSLDGYDAYLAGPPAMIEATIPVLTGLGVRPANVHFDAFLPSRH
jgi:propane monooxygenase reductase subunit